MLRFNALPSLAVIDYPQKKMMKNKKPQKLSVGVLQIAAIRKAMAERDAGEQRTMPWPLSYLAAALTPAAAAADPAPKTERFLDESSKLSLINGTVKHLTRRQLKHELSLKGLDTTGIDDIVRCPSFSLPRMLSSVTGRFADS